MDREESLGVLCLYNEDKLSNVIASWVWRRQDMSCDLKHKHFFLQQINSLLIRVKPELNTEQNNSIKQKFQEKTFL